MNRRTYLTALGVGAASLAGHSALADGNPLPPFGEGKRGEGEPVSVEQTITDDSIAYLEESDEVRYVRYYSGGEPEEYTTEPFTRWAKRTCASVGIAAVLPTIEERSNTPVEGLGSGVEGRLTGTVITVDYTIVLNRDGGVKDGPSVPFADIVEVAPRAVRATVVLDDREYTRVVPVVVQRAEQAQADTLSESS